MLKTIETQFFRINLDNLRGVTKYIEIYTLKKCVKNDIPLIKNNTPILRL